MAEFESLVAAATTPLGLLSILALRPFALFPVDTVNVPTHHLIDFTSSSSVYLLPFVLHSISILSFLDLIFLVLWNHSGCFLEFTLLVKSSLLFLGELDSPGAAVFFKHGLG